MTLSKMYNDNQQYDAQHNNTGHNDIQKTFIFGIMLTVIIPTIKVDYLYAGCIKGLPSCRLSLCGLPLCGLPL
jgi:hypothetical protein